MPPPCQINRRINQMYTNARLKFWDVKKKDSLSVKSVLIDHR